MRPAYIGYENKQREELLSQTGNFTPAERGVFHKLCQNWQERIPYNRFIAILGHDDAATPGDVVSLLTKLRKARMGMLRTTFKDGTRHRDVIILTDENSPAFFAELAEELFNDMQELIQNPLPLLTLVRDQIGEIPPGAIQRVSPDELGTFFSGKQQAERPLAVTTLDDEALLVTQPRLRSFVTITILKMRHFLSNTTLLGAVAKLQDTSLLNLKQKCAGKEPAFWLSLTQTIIGRKRDLEAMRAITIDTNFFHAAALLKNLIESQIHEAKQKKEEEENRQLDLDAIAMAIKEDPDQWVEQDQVTRMLEGQKEKYGERFEQFREEFYERFVHARGKNTLPKVVLLNRRYIHRDNIFPSFLVEFRALEAELSTHFALFMEEHLKSGNRNKDTTFTTLENFNEAIGRQVEARSEFVTALIAKPSILAEAMILHMKQNKLAGDVNELKQKLAVYFDPETMQPLPLNEWFNLRQLDLFERAFEKLPILRRIWIRLTGKYESFRGRYLGNSTGAGASSTRLLRDRAAPSVAAVEPRGTAQRSGQRSTRGSSSPPSSHRRPATRRGATAQSAKRSDGTGSAAQKKRAYSKKQVDSAWDEFGNTIKKGDR